MAHHHTVHLSVSALPWIVFFYNSVYERKSYFLSRAKTVDCSFTSSVCQTHCSGSTGLLLKNFVVIYKMLNIMFELKIFLVRKKVTIYLGKK